MNFKRFLVTTLSTSIAALSISADAEAIIASVKTFGMAATGIAYPQDALAAAFNPAGNAEIGDRLDVEAAWAHNDGHTKIHGNGLTGISNPVLLAFANSRFPNINGTYPGYKTKDNYPVNFGINKTFGCNCEYNVGLVVYNRNQSKTTYNRPLELLGTSNLGMEYLHETVSGVFAWKINECFNVGVNLNYMVQRLKVNGIEKAEFPPPASALHPVVSVSPNHVTNKGYNYSTGWGVTLGAQWHILPCLTVGATYQPETSMTKFGKYKGFVAHHGKFNIPPVYSAGIAWRWVECSTIAFDVQHYAWNKIPSLHNDLLHDGHLEPLGSKNGPGFGWKSQTFYRVGIDYALTEEWTIRAGFRHGNSPIRPSQTVVNQLTLDTVEDFATCGATWAYNACQEVSAFFAYGFQNTIKGKDSIPVGNPVPFNSPPFTAATTAPGFGGGNSDLTQRIVVVGLGWGWNY